MLRGVSAQYGEPAQPPGQQQPPNQQQPPGQAEAAVAQLFDRVGRLGRINMLAGVSGSLRFDIAEDEQVVDQWSVLVQNGRISVEHRGGDADCVVSVGMELLGGMACGQSNAMSALLRGDMMVTGDVQLLVLLERLLPGPAGAHGPRRTVTSQGAG